MSDMHGMGDMHGTGGMSGEAPSGNAWATFKALRDEIAQVIGAGKLAEVHAKAARLAPLGDALAAGARELPEDKRIRVEATLRQLPGVVDALHDAADGGDAAATQRGLERLDGVIALIEAQFPAEVREKVVTPGMMHAEHEGGTAMAHEHGGHSHTSRPLAAVDEAPTATLRVVASGFKFEPHVLTLRVGEPTRIELENHDAVEHALVVAAADGNGDLIHLHAMANSSDAGTYRIDARGHYPALCTIAGHTEAGMIAEVVVD
jgi:plastocyanin